MCCVLVHVHPNQTQQTNQINHIKQTWAIYNPHIHACVYHVCIECVCVCVKCMHMHLHCICVLTPTLVEHKDCRCICRHGMHTMGCILSTKLTSTKLEIVETKSCRCICRHACVVCLCMCMFACSHMFSQSACAHNSQKCEKARHADN